MGSQFGNGGLALQNVGAVPTAADEFPGKALTPFGTYAAVQVLKEGAATKKIEVAGQLGLQTAEFAARVEVDKVVLQAAQFVAVDLQAGLQVFLARNQVQIPYYT